MRRAITCIASLLVVALASGCAPMAAVNVGMYAVGKVIDDQDTRKLADRLVGQPASAADKELGSRVNTLRDVNGSRRWITYSVKMDVASLKRYVVEVANNQIVAVKMIQIPTGQVDVARSLACAAIVQGQTPQVCQEKLGVGPPAMTLRSEVNGQLVQLYNGQLIKDVGDQKYLILRFGPDGRCQKLDLVDVMASADGVSTR